ncbi:MAG: hypothetical protein NVS1B3_10620 [Candidatus Dormibacteraceae bacterium]
MKAARGWIIAVLLSIAVGAALYSVQPHQDSPEHSSSSDAANGASAVRLFAESMGHSTAVIAGTFNPPSLTGLMFVFTPTSPFTANEAQSIRTWVSAGNVIVYASEQGDPELDRVFGVRRSNTTAFISREVATPVVAGVTNVAGSRLVAPLQTTAEQVAMLRSSTGLVLGYLQKRGSGVLVVLADPLMLCNGYLDKKDNGRLLADLLGLSASGRRVYFDEYHHGVNIADFSPQAWITTPWGAALLWLIIAVFVGLLLRGRAFGPLIPRPAQVARADLEWAVAVGALLRRSSAHAVTLGVLASATERAVAIQTGIPPQPRERFWNALWVRVPEIAAELAEAENALHAPGMSEPELLKAAQRLHRIAHPVSGRVA